MDRRPSRSTLPQAFLGSGSKLDFTTEVCYDVPFSRSQYLNTLSGMSKTSSTNNEDPKTQAIVMELERRAHMNIDAMNKRDFSPTSDLYYLKIKDWRATAAVGMGAKEMSLEEFVQSLSKLAKDYPQFKATLRDMSTSVNVKQDAAQMYINVDMEGVPPGIVRQSVAIVAYRLVDGVWMGCSHRALPGMNDGFSA